MSAKKNTAAAPLARFVLAPENARHGVEYDADGLAALAGSIRAFGRLLEPLKVYQDGESLMVWDGGRRLAALQLLAQDETPPALLDAVAFDLATKEEAALASVATFLREPMHPADRFAAYSALFDAGQTAEQIAAACAVSAKGVAQLLRFRLLAPEVLTAFRAGRMDFEACLAFTLDADQDAQRAVLDSFGDRPINEWQVKGAFRREAVRGDSFTARIVGRDAYEAAGGRFLVDLFSDHEESEQWQDGGLLGRLFEAAVAERVAEAQAEGWGAVRVVENQYETAIGYHRADPEGEAFTEAERADLTAFVIYQRHPEKALVIEGGWRSHKAQPGEANDTGEAKPKPATEDPARWGWGHGGHGLATRQATIAVRSALLANPAAAYDALVAHLAWDALGWSGEAITGLRMRGGPASEAEADARTAWKARLNPVDRSAFYDAVAALDASEKAELLALCFAMSVNVAEDRTDGHDKARWAQLGWTARHAGVTLADFGTPSEAFLKGGSRPALLTAVADLAPGEEVRQAEAKKGALVTYVGHKATEAGGWAPLLLRDLLVAPEAEAPAKAPRKGRGRGKPEAAAPDAVNDADALADAA